MKESNTLVGNATIKQLQREVLLNTKGQYMKESNTLADNATIKLLQRAVLLNTKGRYMKELNDQPSIVKLYYGGWWSRGLLNNNKVNPRGV